jgi:hypothetical protein
VPKIANRIKYTIKTLSERGNLNRASQFITGSIEDVNITAMNKIAIMSLIRYKNQIPSRTRIVLNMIPVEMLTVYLLSISL